MYSVIFRKKANTKRYNMRDAQNPRPILLKFNRFRLKFRRKQNKLSARTEF